MSIDSGKYAPERKLRETTSILDDEGRVVVRLLRRNCVLFFLAYGILFIGGNHLLMVNEVFPGFLRNINIYKKKHTGIFTLRTSLTLRNVAYAPQPSAPSGGA